MVLVQKWTIFQLFFQLIQARKMSITIFQSEKTPFQAIKTRTSKSRKLGIFAKGLTHEFGLKMAVFPTFIYQAIQARKMSCTIFQNEETPFYAIKTRSSKSRKIDIFPKWLTHGFGPKMSLFPTFFFKQYTPGKCLLQDSRTKKTLFYAIKTKSSKSRKICIFSNGLTHGFDLQMAVFPTFIFQAIQARKISFTIFQHEKTPLQPMKIKSSKSRKTDIFPKGLTHSFGPKFAFFQTVFLRQYRPGKCILRHSRTKKHLSRL